MDVANWSSGIAESVEKKRKELFRYGLVASVCR